MRRGSTGDNHRSDTVGGYKYAWGRSKTHVKFLSETQKIREHFGDDRIILKVVLKKLGGDKVQWWALVTAVMSLAAS